MKRFKTKTGLLATLAAATLVFTSSSGWNLTLGTLF